MDHNNNPHDEAPEQFEFELTDEQLEAVAGGADPRDFIKNINSKEIEAGLTPGINPTVVRPSQSATLSGNK